MAVVEFLQMFILLYIFLYIFIYVCVFAYFSCVFVYILGFCSYKLDRLMGGGRLRRPPLIKQSILYEENPKIHTKTHKLYANTQKYMSKFRKIYEEMLC